MAEASYEIGLVVEAAADARTVQLLVDRCLCGRLSWLEADMLGSFRSWRGLEPEHPFSEWTRAAGLAREHRILAPGNFDGEPGRPYARRAAKTLRLFAKLGFPDAVILVVDADDQPERRAGLEQARETSAARDQVIVGVAIPKREAWILAGFLPRDDTERQRLASERQRLGFDPTAQPHRLGTGGGKREAKLAYSNLIGDRDRETECLTKPDLEMLSQRGAQAGLAHFLEEAGERLERLVMRPEGA